ncbi:MAG: glycosyltransferase, partial [Acidobacteria bacterium]
MSLPETPRANLLGIGISAVNMPEALRLIHSVLARGKKGYICVTGVHGIMEAQRDPCFKRILNDSFLTTPDGLPTVWVGK